MRRVGWIGVAVLGAIATWALILGFQPSSKGLPGPVSRGNIPPFLKASAPAVPATTTPPLTSSLSVPVSLQIPEIGVSGPLAAPLGLAANGTVQVPSGTAQASWYDGSPDPGQQGSAVILGHVDSYQGPGIFFNLRELLPGQTFTVTQANGTVDTFQVTDVGQYLKSAFPTALVYTPHGYAGLNLVTCGGAFDSATGHYLSNIVVFSKLESIAP